MQACGSLKACGSLQACGLLQVCGVILRGTADRAAHVLDRKQASRVTQGHSHGVRRVWHGGCHGGYPELLTVLGMLYPRAWMGRGGWQARHIMPTPESSQHARIQRSLSHTPAHAQTHTQGLPLRPSPCSHNPTPHHHHHHHHTWASSQTQSPDSPGPESPLAHKDHNPPDSSSCAPGDSPESTPP